MNVRTRRAGSEAVLLRRERQARKRALAASRVPSTTSSYGSGQDRRVPGSCRGNSGDDRGSRRICSNSFSVSGWKFVGGPANLGPVDRLDELVPRRERRHYATPSDRRLERCHQVAADGPPPLIDVRLGIGLPVRLVSSFSTNCSTDVWLNTCEQTQPPAASTARRSPAAPGSRSRAGRRGPRRGWTA